MAQNFPHPIPNGWFSVAYADELAPGEVERVHYFDQDLVLFRTESGAVHVVDPYCPHLGAHLGHGGQVEGESIRCPFHGWRFAGDGACVDVPYAERIPPAARLRSWPTLVRNGFVFVWRHAEGAAPFYEIPELAEIESDEWDGPSRLEWVIAAQFGETIENVVDPAHFRFVHGTKTVPEPDITFEGATLHSRNVAKMQTPKGVIDGCIDAFTVGPGFGFTRYAMGGEMLQIGGSTPIDAIRTQVHFAFYTRGSSVERGLGAAMVREIDRQMGQDIPIWENKTHHVHPVLCDGDGPIAGVRKWMLQFYSE